MFLINYYIRLTNNAILFKIQSIDHMMQQNTIFYSLPIDMMMYIRIFINNTFHNISSIKKKMDKVLLYHNDTDVINFICIQSFM